MGLADDVCPSRPLGIRYLGSNPLFDVGCGLVNVAEHSIILALLNAKRPMTAKEISRRTRTSLAAVYRICTESNAILCLGGRPAQFYAKRYDELDTNHILVDYYHPEGGWINWIENANISLDEVLDIDTNDLKKRNTQAEALRALGILFLSLSQDINTGLSRPDWRDLLER